tara:strand:- start:5187 stop:5849 length:663 start_codon:yes stop_codon:yes gene_type:complete
MMGTIALAEVNLTAVRTQLDSANQLIAINESGLKSIETTLESLRARVRKECGVDLNSTKSSQLKCSMDTFAPLVQQFSQLKTAETKINDQLTGAKRSYKKILKESKGQLTPADYSSLLETSGDLSDTEIRKLKMNAKADALKAELNQAKSAIEQTEQYKFLTKALTNTLNSNLFCQARDRCDEKAGNIYEGDVTAKILSNAASSLAKSKVNTKGTVGAPK